MNHEVLFGTQQRNDLANFLTQRGSIHSRNRHGGMDFRLAGITQAIARAADGEALLVQQLADTPDQQHLMVLVVAAVAAALDRLELGEFLLPIAQHMRLDPAQFADFTDGEIAFGGDRRELGIRLVVFHDRTFPPWFSVFGWDETSPRAAP